MWLGAPDAEGGWGWGQGLHPAGFRVLASRLGGWGAPQSLASASRPLTHILGPCRVSGSGVRAENLCQGFRAASSCESACILPESDCAAAAPWPRSGPWRSEGWLRGPCGENQGLSSLEAQLRPRTCSLREGPCLRESLDGAISEGCPGHSLRGQHVAVGVAALPVEPGPQDPCAGSSRLPAAGFRATSSPY